MVFCTIAFFNSYLDVVKFSCTCQYHNSIYIHLVEISQILEMILGHRSIENRDQGYLGKSICAEVEIAFVKKEKVEIERKCKFWCMLCSPLQCDSLEMVRKGRRLHRNSYNYIWETASLPTLACFHKFLVMKNRFTKNVLDSFFSHKTLGMNFRQIQKTFTSLLCNEIPLQN